jgi:heme/copper-type cytochrome/quinol oxidase subunit 4
MSQTSLSVPSGESGDIPAMTHAGRRKFSPVFDALKFDLAFGLVIPPERKPLMWCLVAFVVTFFVTRTIVRYIRAHADSDAPRKWWQPRNIGHGALHIHHVVIGVVLVMISGVTMVTLAVDGGVPEFTAAAIFFGIGAALVLDEFALILHLEDVYWSEDGRTSVDAVFAAVAVAGLLILGFNPLSFFDVSIWREDQSWQARAVVILAAAATLMIAVIVLLKGKVWTGLIGMFITPLLFIGAFRLSRPHAPWARWRYGDRPRKMHRAMERERRLRRPIVQAKLWLQHVVAGEPHFPDDSEVDQELDREIHAAPAPPERGTAKGEAA